LSPPCGSDAAIFGVTVSNGCYLRIAAVHRAVFERPPAQARD
jgi:hypothetical protein